MQEFTLKLSEDAVIDSQRCESCDSENLRKFGGEIGIHFPGLRNIEMPTVFLFPELVVCLACGHAQFTVPDDKLRLLAQGHAAAA